MGVAYGAASLWQWRLHPDEPGHASFFLAEASGWREALEAEGSRYVGLVPQILEGLPITDMEPNWQVTLGRRGLLVPGKLYIGYAAMGGLLHIVGDGVPRNFRVIDPRNGRIVREGTRESARAPIADSGGEPRVYLCCDEGWPQNGPRQS